MTLSEYQHQHISAASSVVGVAVRDGVRAGGTQVIFCPLPFPPIFCFCSSCVVLALVTFLISVGRTTVKNLINIFCGLHERAILLEATGRCTLM